MLDWAKKDEGIHDFRKTQLKTCGPVKKISNHSHVAEKEVWKGPEHQTNLSK